MDRERLASYSTVEKEEIRELEVNIDEVAMKFCKNVYKPQTYVELKM